jgi:hypothetical protein
MKRETPPPALQGVMILLLLCTYGVLAIVFLIQVCLH